MSYNPHWAIAAINGAINTRMANLNGGTMTFYTGVQPTNPDTALSGNTALVTLTFSATAFGSASGGIATANSITTGTASATGTATFVRCYNSSAVAMFDGSVGVTGGSFDVTIPSTSIATSQSVPCTSFTFQEIQ